MTLSEYLIPAVTLAGGLLSGWFLKPKALAEARKAGAEADVLDWDRFQKEIARLDKTIAEQAREIESLKVDREGRQKVTDKREGENRSLRKEIEKLKTRLGLLEELFHRFSIDPDLPPNMLEQIHKLRDVP